MTPPFKSLPNSHDAVVEVLWGDGVRHPGEGGRHAERLGVRPALH